MPAEQYVDVVTRYGGHLHRAVTHDTHGMRTALDPDAGGDRGRLSTICRATSAWTLMSWATAPDHPFLTVEQMAVLPRCLVCLEEAPLNFDEPDDERPTPDAVRLLLQAGREPAVVYRPHPSVAPERGVIVALIPGSDGAFVRYGQERNAKATPLALLRLVPV